MTALIIKRPETRVPFCLDGDLKAAHEATEADYNQQNNLRLSDDRFASSARKKAEQLQAIEEQMKESTVTFIIRGLPRGEWAELTADNPPREKNTLDAQFGYNVETLMTTAIPRSIVKVTNNQGDELPFDTSVDWEPLAKEMTNSQYEDFVLAVMKVNAGRNDVPFSLSAFRLTQDSEKK